MTFDDGCSLIEAALEPGVRGDIVSEASTATDLGGALGRLGEAMRTHTFRAGTTKIALDNAITALDQRTAKDGFHVLHDWHGPSKRFNDDSIPLDVLRFVMNTRGADEVNPAVPAMLLDYYFTYLLALLSLRVWDDGHPNENLDRLQRMLETLQGPGGSGQPFVSDAETLMLLGTSHYEPEEHGYPTLLRQCRELNHFHQTRVGISHAGSMGGHLRFGYEATYNRDLAAQRADNVVDYPWVYFALGAAMREYARMHDEGIPGVERERVVEALVAGMSGDAVHFMTAPARNGSADDAERLEFVEMFRQHKSSLIEEFERLRPTGQRYSPLSLFFNFSHNIVKGTLIDAVMWGEPWPFSFNDLLTGVTPAETNGRSKETLVKTLMGYARQNPDTIRGRLMPVVVYDTDSGRRAFGAAMRAVKSV
jgi:hypothetical protein